MKKLFTIACLLATGSSFGQSLQGDFENWRTYTSGGTSLDAPQGWYTADSLIYYYSSLGLIPQKQVLQSNTAHSGTHAASLKSANYSLIGTIIPGVLTNAKINFDLNAFMGGGSALDAIGYTGGTPVSQYVPGIFAWTKYTPTGNDTAMMVVQAIKNTGGNLDSVIGEGYAYITQSASWQQIFCNINYYGSLTVPDTVVVAFLSSFGSSAQDNSTLLVDDVDFLSVGVNDINREQNIFTIYPNPAKDVVSIETKQNDSYTWEVYNLHGQKLAEQNFIQKANINISALPNGMYTYRIADKNGALVQRGKLDVVR